MPIYRWRDTLTGQEVEVVRRPSQIDEPPTHEANECTANEHNWERIICGTSFKLAGTGWASDGYTKPGVKK